MKISPIGPVSTGSVASVYTDFFSQPVVRSHIRSQKNRLLVDQLEPKDKVTISPEARMLSVFQQKYQHEAIAKTGYKLPGYELPVPGLPQNSPAPPEPELQLPIGKPEQPPQIHSPFPQPPSDRPPFAPQPPGGDHPDGIVIVAPGPPVGRPEFPDFPELPPFIPAPGIAPPTTRPEPPMGSLPIDEDRVGIPEKPWTPGIGPPHINPSDDFTIPEDILESIKQIIADKLSVPIEDITIIDQKQVSWSDTSMGNPQPGFFYAQVIVPGYKITVQVGEDKHVGEFYAVLDYGGSQLEYVVGPDPLHDQPPVVAIPEQRNPESPDPMPEESKTLPIAPVPPLQNPEQSISRDQIKLYINNGDNHG